jgi:hypothetical protein
MSAGNEYAVISEGRSVPAIGLRDTGLEKSGQTFTPGAPLARVGGYILEYDPATHTVIYGWAECSGSDTATDGEVRTKFLVNKPGLRVEGTLLQALAATTPGTKVGLVKGTASTGDGEWYFSSAAAVKQLIVRGWSNKWAIADTKAVVEAEVLDAYDLGSE